MRNSNSFLTSKNPATSFLVRIIFVGILFFCCKSNCLLAQEDWSKSFPGGANIGQNVTLKREHLELHVPKSFEGRTANEWRTSQGVEFQNTARFFRTDSKVQLRGKTTTFEFDYTQDALDVQIFRSRQRIPGSNSCMDCHGGNFSRTTAIIGEEHQEIIPKPYKRGFITIFLDPATSESFHSEINHWLNQNLMLKADYRWGYLKQGNYSLEAKAYTIGLAGRFKHRLTWSGDLIISKADTYPQRKSFIGKLNFRLFEGLKIGVSGGAFLDGYTQFGTEMSEMGLITTTMAKDDPNLLPSLFTKLKDDKFGYWHYTIEYEYRF
ncbi:MAG: hypothetical protein Kow0029_15180 [Candidatus Rifleibacteriota bacterium]